jgi:L-seryl-tRNA(Ser) seleniumtransferase
MSDPRRQLPSVDRLLNDPAIAALAAHVPRNALVAAVRESLERARRGRAGPPSDWAADVSERLARGSARSLRPVINATGVVLHTNLGRAPLARAALDAIRDVGQGYSALEYDLGSGIRGHRADHCRRLLAQLTGAPDALAVNNAAGALVLALNATAAGGRVIISRGELIEIGGSFRIPEILEKSGATLVEVGTTNRTYLDDYRRALGPDSIILTVHRSNFEQRGFVTSPAPADLASLARESGVPYIHDVGSGLLADLSDAGLTGEPRVQDGIAAGADLVIFSGDKLLGGPQAGCLVGRADLIDACRRNPFARALRADKFTLAALEATLALYRDPDAARHEIPVLAMLTLSPPELARRAAVLSSFLPEAAAPAIVPGQSAVGGGAFPGATLPTALVALDAGPLGANGLALRLRLGDPAVVARVENDRVVLDPRTLRTEELELVGRAVKAALAEE